MANMESTLKLDEDFDSLLLQIKPYVMGMVDRTERQRCASWIKKLCQYTEAAEWEKKNRNTYTKLLFHMLKRGNIDHGIFRFTPPEGPLESLSSATVESFMTMPTDTPRGMRQSGGFGDSSRQSKVASIAPSWVETELDDETTSNYKFQHGTKYSSSNINSTGLKRSSSLRPNSALSEYETSKMSSALPWQRPASQPQSNHNSDNIRTSSTAYDYTNLPSWKYLSNLSSSSHDKVKPSGVNGVDDNALYSHLPSSFSNRMSTNEGRRGMDEVKNYTYQTTSPMSNLSYERELEAQKKLYESKLLEEKKTLELQYDREIKKLVEIKAQEVEQTHSQYRKRITELESKSKELADKLTSLQQEADTMRRGKDRQITELKQLAQSNLENLQKDYEGKIMSLHSQFEEERTKLEEAHAESIQEIIDDTNKRLQKMENEYVQQQSTSTKLVEDLESRITSLTCDVDRNREEKFELERRNMELEYECRALNEGFVELKARLEKFEHKYVDTVDSLRKDKLDTVHKYESNCENMKKTHAEKTDELMQKICEMDDRMLEMKQKLQDTVLESDRRIKEAESSARRELSNCEQSYEKRLKELQLNYNLDVKELESKLKRSEASVNEKQIEIDKLIEAHRKEMSQSQLAFDNFKKQIDTAHSKVYDEMRTQIGRIEMDLNESKSIREQQASEYEMTIDNMRTSHEKAIEDLRIKSEEDKDKLLKKFHDERQHLINKHDESLQNLTNKMEQRNANNEIAHKTELKRREKYLAEVEASRDKFREQLIELEATRKQQLMEVGLKMEQLRTKFNSDRELIAAKCRAAFDNEKQQLMEKHEMELKDVIKRSSERENKIDNECKHKILKQSERVSELENEVETWKKEMLREEQEHETKLKELLRDKKAEMTSLKKEHSVKLNNVLNELESSGLKVKALEKRLTERECEYEHEVNQLILSHNAKIKSMLPSSVREELESTIESLKSQIHSLQQTLLILQNNNNNNNNNNITATDASLYNKFYSQQQNRQCSSPSLKMQSNQQPPPPSKDSGRKTPDHINHNKPKLLVDSHK